MRASELVVALGLLALVAACSRPTSPPPPSRARASIRDVDFAHRRYESRCGHREPGPGDGGDEEFVLAVQNVEFGDLTADGIDDAVVLLTCTTGGTAGPQPEIHVFTMREDTVVRLATFDGGTKFFGTEDVAIDRGTLRIVRSFQAVGAAMAVEEETETVRWDGQQFVRVELTPRRTNPDLPGQR